jgi:archaemetzincin
MRNASVILLTAFMLCAAGMLIYYSMASTPEPRPEGAPYSPEKLHKTIKKLEPLHKKLGKPQPGDWLDRHREPGQSFRQYLYSNPVTPSKTRKTIYVLPIGNFTKKQTEVLETTCAFMEIYFNLPVKKLASIDDSKIPEKARRKHPSWGMKQFLSTYILDEILKPRLPKDGMVLFGITATDLWPGEGWNFVYGQASLRERVGVQSIFRNGDLDKGEDERLLFLRRTLKTATHEMGHVISILHCIAWECNMCGSNHRAESDRHPLWMCPECVAKVCWAVQIDPKKRYLNLYKFCAKKKLNKAAVFFRKSFLTLGGTEQELK